jgi:hypothetical protein
MPRQVTDNFGDVSNREVFARDMRLRAEEIRTQRLIDDVKYWRDRADELRRTDRVGGEHDVASNDVAQASASPQPISGRRCRDGGTLRAIKSPADVALTAEILDHFGLRPKPAENR